MTSISSSSISDVGTLLTSAVATTPREFTTGSFDNLASLTISDAEIDVDSLNTAISNANSAVAGGTVPVLAVANAEIKDGNEAAFADLMAVEGAAGTDNINLGAQLLTIDDGTISSITNANNFTASTTGTVSGEIVNTTSVADLTTLTNDQANACSLYRYYQFR